ncbi:hypothetical protein GCM10025768_27460 [Microbacterium pseudoresistens]|uniref:allantoinase n=1 Tax=Microbacterium pseudoresistens TaxID=640634 RepID=A0A7Y9EVS9_9MICO|nr:allantoinase [Microbacterium pseudoresistens]
MRVLIAPDKFKGSLSAAEAAERIAEGIHRVDPSTQVVVLPVADGGEGTVEAALAAGFARHTAVVAGPGAVPVEASFALRGTDAVVEMAQASGLDLVAEDERDARAATSLGTGQLLRAALDAGARRIVLGVGGSASTDGGAGVLQGLGARLLDAAGVEIALGGGALADLDRIDLSELDPRVADVELILAADVDNPLRGENGAPAVFGPQKGASERDVATLDDALGRFVEVLDAVGDDLAIIPSIAAEMPGAGAAGGVGYAALLLGAVRRPGVDVVLELTGVAEALQGVDAVITGEGSLDGQSLGGKTPVGVARAAARAAIPTYAVCGRSTLSAEESEKAGFAGVRALADIEPDAKRSMAEAGPLLADISEALAAQIRPLGFDLVLRGRALIDGAITSVEIGVRQGRIARVAPAGADLEAPEIVDAAADELILPGLVDTHVHVNDPGRTEWEGFESATRAAAAGGVTTIVDMPLNSIPPTVTVEALEIKRATAEGNVFVDVGFWGGVIPGNLEDLSPLHEAGVYGFKCFLLPSGVDEFPEVSVDEMRDAMGVLAGLGSMIIVHAEDAHIIDESGKTALTGPAYADFLASRPRSAEDAAIAEVIAAAAETGARAHILHLSNGDSIDRIAAARAEGIDLSVETCPHYLTLSAEDIPSGATAFKCCPPIREDDNRGALWKGLEDGVIDYIVSDHSPSTPEMKYAGDGDFSIAWGGIASLQLGLPVVWTEARRRGIPLERVVALMSQAPADRVGLRDKGRIVQGAAADFAVFAPEETFTVDARVLSHRHPITPYDGRELTGVVRASYLAGERIDPQVPRGRLLRNDGGVTPRLRRPLRNRLTTPHGAEKEKTA